jgi:hypothetical protein
MPKLTPAPSIPADPGCCDDSCCSGTNSGSCDCESGCCGR